MLRDLSHRFYGFRWVQMNSTRILFVLLLWSGQLSAALNIDWIKTLVDFEIGKTGGCSTYVSYLPSGVKHYSDRQRLLSSRKIGTASAADVNAAQASSNGILLL
jgi:hypothetical protein